jgi:hypothetical protein
VTTGGWHLNIFHLTDRLTSHQDDRPFLKRSRVNHYECGWRRRKMARDNERSISGRAFAAARDGSASHSGTMTDTEI